MESMWLLVSVHHLGSPRSLNLGTRELVGNTKHPKEFERKFRRSSVLNHMSGRDRALLRSQSGLVAGVTLSSTPSSPLTRIEPALFRVLLQRRLALPLPLSNRTCRCGRPLDASGHYRAACARCGVLGRRGFGAILVQAISAQTLHCLRVW